MPRGLPTIVFFVLVAGGLGALAWWMTRAQTPAAGMIPAGSSSPSFTVMAANVRLATPNDGDNAWEKRRDLLVKVLLKYQADVIACQEVSPAQGAFLNKELQQWYAYYPRAGVGEASTSQRSAVGEVLGALRESLASLNTMYYRKDRFDIVDGEAGLVIPEEPQANATENALFSLAVLKRKLVTDSVNAEPNPVEYLIVVDAHLRHNEAFAAKCAARLRERIMPWQQKYPNSGIVVLGDLNHGRGTQMYAMLVSNSAQIKGPPLLDTIDYSQNMPAGTLATFHGFKGKSVNVGPTDLIFYGGSVVMEKPAVVVKDHEGERWPSDHYFVLAPLRFKGGK